MARDAQMKVLRAVSPPMVATLFDDNTHQAPTPTPSPPRTATRWGLLAPRGLSIATGTAENYAMPRPPSMV